MVQALGVSGRGLGFIGFRDGKGYDGLQVVARVSNFFP